jgi:protein SCO1/2
MKSTFDRSRLRAFALSLLPLAAPIAHAHDAAADAPASARHSVAATERFLSAEPELAVIAPAREFVLRDTDGQEVRLSDHRGRVVLLAFIFTSCSQACPLITRQMAMLQAQLNQAGLFPNKASFLSVTVEPQADSAEVLARYAKTFGADPAGWRFLLDSPEKLDAVLTEYDEWTKRLPDGDIDHPARLFLIDQKGDIREIYSLAFFDERQAYLDIRALLRESR